ncbi:MAG TPA: hypothetical protein VFT78_12090 [Hanamia sp.]|nr:hypothetical protein [Hanamia sp.]
MKKLLFSRQHLMDYLFYGFLAAIFYSISVWFYVYDEEFRQAKMMYIGVGFFAFIMMLYQLKIADGEKSKKNLKEIIFSGHLAVITGIIFSTLICYFLCFEYKPSAFKISSTYPGQSPASLFAVFIPAILVNFLAGSFISLSVAYAMKMTYLFKKKTISL